MHQLTMTYLQSSLLRRQLLETFRNFSRSLKAHSWKGDGNTSRINSLARHQRHEVSIEERCWQGEDGRASGSSQALQAYTWHSSTELQSNQQLLVILLLLASFPSLACVPCSKNEQWLMMLTRWNVLAVWWQENDWNVSHSVFDAFFGTILALE